MNLESRARAHAALGDDRRLLIADILRYGDRTVLELGNATGLSGNLLAHHLGVMEDAGLVERRVSEGDRRRRYVTLRRDAMALLSQGRATTGDSVLFVCRHNSARSQYAAARWQERTGATAPSAGEFPAETVNPIAVRVASEFGLDLSGAIPRGYGSIEGPVDLLVSVCDRTRESPLPAAGTHFHWSIPDPVASGTIRAFRRAFAEIDARIDNLVRSI